MESKFKIGDRVVWKTAPGQPQGKITDGPIEDAKIRGALAFYDKYVYPVSYTHLTLPTILLV